MRENDFVFPTCIHECNFLYTSRIAVGKKQMIHLRDNPLLASKANFWEIWKKFRYRGAEGHVDREKNSNHVNFKF